MIAITPQAAAAIGAALVLLSPSWSQAATIRIIQSGAEHWLLLDPATIEATPHPGVRKAWTVAVQRRLLSGRSGQAGYVRTLNHYDCLSRRIWWRSFSVYSQNGAPLLKKDNDTVDWAPAPSGSVEDATLRIVCEGGGGEAVVTANSLGAIVSGIMQGWDQPGAPAAASVSPAAPSRPGR